MTGTHVDPEAVAAMAAKLRGISDDLEAGATPAPEIDGGTITDAVVSAIALLSQGIGNVSTSAASIGDAVAAGKDLTVDIDYEAAVSLKQQEINDTQPPG